MQMKESGAGVELECIADYGCETGESPLWHALEKRVYWSDIPRGRIFRYDPTSGAHEKCYEGRPVGGFTVQSDGSMLLFMDRGTIAHWNAGELTEVVTEIAEERDTRFNDVIADPRGRVYCGTMSNGASKGRLYRLDVDGTLHVLLEGIGCSNGMAFTSDRKGFYYTDSFAGEIYLFDYDEHSGSLTNQRVFAHFEESEGLPDGMTLDAEGRVWCAFWDGGCVARLDGNGVVEKRIAMPARKCSSLTFGGENYADMYITTAGGDIKAEDGDLAGALFRIRGQARGVAEFLSRIQVRG